MTPPWALDFEARGTTRISPIGVNNRSPDAARASPSGTAWASLPYVKAGRGGIEPPLGWRLTQHNSALFLRFAVRMMSREPVIGKTYRPLEFLYASFRLSRPVFASMSFRTFPTNLR